jgi:hypothetical protein
MLWGPPPAFIGVTGTGSSGNAPPPTSPEISVDLATVQGAESATLAAETELVNGYNQALQQVQAVISNDAFFGQQATFDSISYARNGVAGDPVVDNMYQHTQVLPDTQLQQAAQQFAAQINPVMTRVLRMVADTTEVFGVYTALLDKSGQAYTAADKGSAIPSEPGSGAPSG